MNDSDYYEMLSQIAELGFLPQASAESVQITSTTDNGYCDIVWKCRKCHAVHTLTNTHFLQAPICACTCGIQNTVEPFRDLTCDKQQLFANLPKDGLIVFWGVGSQYCRIARFYGGFGSERFIQVDGNDHQQKMTRLGRKIYGPQIIIEKGVKNVIITSPVAKNAILKEISSNYPEVTNVFFPVLLDIKSKLMPTFENINLLKIGKTDA